MFRCSRRSSDVIGSGNLTSLLWSAVEPALALPLGRVVQVFGRLGIALGTATGLAGGRCNATSLKMSQPTIFDSGQALATPKAVSQ